MEFDLLAPRVSPLEEGTGYKLCTNEINPELPAGQGYERERRAIDHKTSRWNPVNRALKRKILSMHLQQK